MSKLDRLVQAAKRVVSIHIDNAAFLSEIYNKREAPYYALLRRVAGSDHKLLILAGTPQGQWQLWLWALRASKLLGPLHLAARGLDRAMDAVRGDEPPGLFRLENAVDALLGPDALAAAGRSREDFVKALTPPETLDPLKEYTAAVDALKPAKPKGPPRARKGKDDEKERTDIIVQSIPELVRKLSAAGTEPTRTAVAKAFNEMATKLGTPVRLSREDFSPKRGKPFREVYLKALAAIRSRGNGVPTEEALEADLRPRRRP